MKTLKKSKYKIFILTAAVLIAGAGSLFVHENGNAQSDPVSAPVTVPPPAPMTFTQDGLAIRKQDGEELYFNVELALTGPQQSRGLMYRTELADNAGMLFMFSHPQKLSFWMKNTLIPLDMLFISADGRIHHIHHNARPQDETSITSKYDSKAVLELKGGTADKMGIAEGDQVIHPYFKNDQVAPQ